MVLLIVSMLGVTLVTLGRVEYAISANYRSKTSAVHLADAALEATLADLTTAFEADPSDNWLHDWVNTGANPPAPIDPFPDPDGTQVNGMTLTRQTMSPSPYPGTPYALGDPESLGNGTFQRIIWLPPTVTSTGNGSYRVDVRTRAIGTDTSGEGSSAVIVDALTAMELTTTSAYKSGLFFGGLTGGLGSGGRVLVAGSMHIIGDDRGRPTRIRFPFGSRQVNSYNGISGPSALGALATKLPPLGMVEYNGETVASLEAVLRLKDVILDIGWRSSIGERDVPGDGDKETIDAIYSDGRIRSSRGGVFSDTTEGYDMGDDVTFPSLSDPYTDPDNGSSYPTYAAWLDAHSYQPILGGDLVIGDSTPSFSHTDPGGNGSIAWDSDTNTLTIDGIVKISGRLEFGDPPAARSRSRRARGRRTRGSFFGESPRGGTPPIQYAGEGVIYATDDITIRTDLYPTGDYLQDGPDPDADIDGNLGMITPRDIQIGPTGRGPLSFLISNTQVIATLYAERSIQVRGRVNIAGAAATENLDVRFGSTVNIWQVPLLGSLYPEGMPAGELTSSAAGSIEAWYQFR